MAFPFTDVSSSYGGSGFASGAAHFPDSPMPTMPPSRGGKSGCKHPFDLTVENKQLKVLDGVVYVGSKKEVEVEGITVGQTFTGTVYLKISWSSGGDFEGELTTSNPGTGDDFVVRKLYDFEDGKAKMDYRVAPVFIMYN